MNLALAILFFGLGIIATAVIGGIIWALIFRAKDTSGYVPEHIRLARQRQHKS